MTLADMSVITAEVKVDETDIVNIQLGQPADITVDALPGRVFKGHVTLVGDQAILRSTGVATSQSTTGTEEAKDFKVIVTLDASDPDLRPGLSTTAKITTAHKANILTLPIQALTNAVPETLDANGKPVPAPTPAAGAKPPATGAGRLRDKDCRRQTSRRLRPHQNRHHRRHRHRSSLRHRRGPGDRNRPVQDPAHS